MNTQVVQEHHGDASTCLRASDSAAQLCAEGCSPTTRRPLPIHPAITPVNQPKAVLLLIVARRPDQTLATTAFGTPPSRQSRMQGNLHFVLQVHVGARQQPH